MTSVYTQICISVLSLTFNIIFLKTVIHCHCKHHFCSLSIFSLLWNGRTPCCSWLMSRRLDFIIPKNELNNIPTENTYICKIHWIQCFYCDWRIKGIIRYSIFEDISYEKHETWFMHATKIYTFFFGKILCHMANIFSHTMCIIFPSKLRISFHIRISLLHEALERVTVLIFKTPVTGIIHRTDAA